MNDDTLKQLRGVMIELLDEFVRVCEEQKYTYFLIAGTLLGAVRHKGFIPWDDDIDVAMPRSDYEKFIDYYENDKESAYYVLSNRAPINTYYHYNSFTKLCKKGTKFAEITRDEENYCGIFIDIWPYDNCILITAPFQTFFIKLWLKLYKIRTYDFIPRNKKRARLKNILHRILPLHLCKMLKRAAEKLYLLHNNYKTNYISFFSGLYSLRKETHKYNSVFPLSKIVFENKYYNAPHDVHNYLKKMYGNYMELPPEEKRKIHGKYVVFSNTDNDNEKTKA